MTALNTYATLAEFKAWKQITNVNITLDADVDRILESVSRHIDGETMRTFNPRIETRYYNTPEELELCLDDDMLAVISITNGDGSSLASTEYHLLPKNFYPKNEVKIKTTSAYRWEYDTDSGSEYVISVNGYWGYHERYALMGWKQVGTLGAAISDTTTASFTMNSGHSAAIGKVYKIDNELFQTIGLSAAVFTVNQRGDMGSTAATHSNGATVYEWQVMSDVKVATLEIAHNVFARRFGESTQSATTVTAAGVVITPKDYGKTTLDTIKRLRKRN